MYHQFSQFLLIRTWEVFSIFMLLKNYNVHFRLHLETGHLINKKTIISFLSIIVSGAVSVSVWMSDKTDPASVKMTNPLRWNTVLPLHLQHF